MNIYQRIIVRTIELILSFLFIGLLVLLGWLVASFLAGTWIGIFNLNYFLGRLLLILYIGFSIRLFLNNMGDHDYIIYNISSDENTYESKD
jgi:hypothetical protein